MEKYVNSRHFGIWIKIITLVIMTSFLCQNAVWASGGISYAIEKRSNAKLSPKTQAKDAAGVVTSAVQESGMSAEQVWNKFREVSREKLEGPIKEWQRLKEILEELKFRFKYVLFAIVCELSYIKLVPEPVVIIIFVVLFAGCAPVDYCERRNNRINPSVTTQGFSDESEEDEVEGLLEEDFDWFIPEQLCSVNDVQVNEGTPRGTYSGYFYPDTGTIEMWEDSVRENSDTLGHETGHAVYYHVLLPEDRGKYEALYEESDDNDQHFVGNGEEELEHIKKNERECFAHTYEKWQKSIHSLITAVNYKDSDILRDKILLVAKTFVTERNGKSYLRVYFTYPDPNDDSDDNVVSVIYTFVELEINSEDIFSDYDELIKFVVRGISVQSPAMSDYVIPVVTSGISGHLNGSETEEIIVLPCTVTGAIIDDEAIASEELRLNTLLISI